MEKCEELYRGKTKVVFATNDKDRLILYFRDDTTVSNEQTIAQLNRKGEVNNYFNAFVMQKLEEAGIPTQFDALLSTNESAVKRLTMLPIECVIRNGVAGYLVHQLGMQEGGLLEPATIELRLRNNKLHYPMINESITLAFKWATAEQLTRMKELTYQVNEVLTSLFDKVDILLADLKLGFGLFHGEVILGNDFSPDSVTFWDKITHKTLGGFLTQKPEMAAESYIEAAHRLGITP